MYAFHSCVCSVMSDSAVPWTVAHQAPLPMEFSRQQYWSGMPLLTPWDLPDPGLKSMSPISLALAGVFFITIIAWEAPLQRLEKPHPILRG